MNSPAGFLATSFNPGNGELHVEGKFYLVVLTRLKQREAHPDAPCPVYTKTQLPLLDWPAKAVFSDADDASRCASALVKENPAGVYAVMEVVALFRAPGRELPPVELLNHIEHGVN